MSWLPLRIWGLSYVTYENPRRTSGPFPTLSCHWVFGTHYRSPFISEPCRVVGHMHYMITAGLGQGAGCGRLSGCLHLQP